MEDNRFQLLSLEVSNTMGLGTCEGAGLVEVDEGNFKGIFRVDFLNKAECTFLARSCPTKMDIFYALDFFSSSTETFISYYSSSGW